MGWLVIVALVPMSRVFSLAGFFWLFSGGVFYTAGGIIYGLKNLSLICLGLAFMKYSTFLFCWEAPFIIF